MVRQFRHLRSFAYWCGAVSLWLSLAFSLGWYYTFTYYGRSGWPLPVPEACGGLLLYYFSVLNVDTEVQALHWMIVFPLAGVLWVLALTITDRRVQHGDGPNVARALWMFALCTVPLILPAPYMAYVAGTDRGPWDFHTMMLVALRREFVSPRPWLSPLYLVLALAAIAAHIAVYRRLFSIRGQRAWRHFLFAAIVFVIVCVTLAATAAIPLRFFFE